MKYKPQLYKERIVATGGKLVYIPLNSGSPYSKSGTDVRYMFLDPSKIKMKFVARPGAKVSALTKEFKADFGFNFPFFDSAAQVPIGTVWDGTKYVNGAYGKAAIWHSFGFKNGKAEIGQLEDIKSYEFALPASPLLVNGGRAVWDYYRELEGTATDIGRDKNGVLVACQRTFVGLKADGTLILAWSDGRVSGDKGLTLEEMALFMIDKGAVVALNGDGGSSTVVESSTGGVFAPYNIEYAAGTLGQALNIGVNERSVHHAVMVFCQEEAPVVVTPPPVTPPAELPWDQAAVKWLKDEGIISSDHDPKANVTWAELGSVLIKFKDKLTK